MTFDDACLSFLLPPFPFCPSFSLGLCRASSCLVCRMEDISWGQRCSFFLVSDNQMMRFSTYAIYDICAHIHNIYLQISKSHCQDKNPFSVMFLLSSISWVRSGSRSLAACARVRAPRQRVVARQFGRNQPSSQWSPAMIWQHFGGMARA